MSAWQRLRPFADRDLRLSIGSDSILVIMGVLVTAASVAGAIGVTVLLL